MLLSDPAPRGIGIGSIDFFVATCYLLNGYFHARDIGRIHHESLVVLTSLPRGNEMRARSGELGRDC